MNENDINNEPPYGYVPSEATNHAFYSSTWNGFPDLTGGFARFKIDDPPKTNVALGFLGGFASVEIIGDAPKATIALGRYREYKMICRLLNTAFELGRRQGQRA